MNKENQEEILLVITSIDGSERTVIVTDVEGDLLLNLNAGETYRLLRRIDSKWLPLEQVIGLRLGDDLKLQFTEDESIVLQDYFRICAVGECVVEMALETAAEGELSYFSLSTDSVSLDLGDGSQLMLAHGDVVTLMQLTQGQSALSQVIEQAQSHQLKLGDVLAEAEAASEETATASASHSNVLALAAVAAVGLIAATELSSSNSNSKAAKPLDKPAEDPDEPAKPLDKPADDSSESVDDSSEPVDDSSEPADDSSEPVDDSSEPADDSSEPADDSSEPVDDPDESTGNSVVEGGASAGPMLADVGLWVVAYQADGTEVSRSELSKEGKYKLVLAEGYIGVLLIRIIDRNGDDVDYIDETTKEPKDLTADLRTVLSIDGKAAYIANINPLTELIVRQLGLPGGNDGESGTASRSSDVSAEKIEAATEVVAKALGLSGINLVSETLELAVDVEGKPNPNVNSYGNLLAIISASEAQQGKTTLQILGDLAKDLADNNGVLSDAAKARLVLAAKFIGLDVSGFVKDLGYDAVEVVLIAAENYNTHGGVAPTLEQYHAAGFDGVTKNNIAALNKLVLGVKPGESYEVEKIKSLLKSAALTTIEEYTGETPLIPEDYLAAEVNSVTANNIEAVNGQVLTAADGAANSTRKIQDLVNKELQQIQLNSIIDDVGAIQGNIINSGFASWSSIKRWTDEVITITDDSSLVYNGNLAKELEEGQVVAAYDGTTYLGDATVTNTEWAYTYTASPVKPEEEEDGAEKNIKFQIEEASNRGVALLSTEAIELFLKLAKVSDYEELWDYLTVNDISHGYFEHTKYGDLGAVVFNGNDLTIDMTDFDIAFSLNRIDLTYAIGASDNTVILKPENISNENWYPFLDTEYDYHRYTVDYHRYTVIDGDASSHVTLVGNVDDFGGWELSESARQVDTDAASGSYDVYKSESSVESVWVLIEDTIQLNII